MRLVELQSGMQVDIGLHIETLRRSYSELCINEHFIPRRARLLNHLLEHSDVELRKHIYSYFTGNAQLTTMVKSCQMEATALVGTLRTDAQVIMDVQKERACGNISGSNPVGRIGHTNSINAPSSIDKLARDSRNKGMGG